MSPLEDGTMPEGFVEAYIPALGEYRIMSFLAYKLLVKHYIPDVRRVRYCPILGRPKRGPKPEEIGRQR